MKNQSHKTRLRAVCLWVMFAASVAPAQQTAALTGPQIFEQVKANYAQCQSYMDTGRVETVFITERGRRTVLKPFTTAFVRPEAFRFEFQERRGEAEWDRYIVWQQGAAIKSLWTMNQQEREFTDLGQALAGPSGVSGGSAVLVPGLLLPNAGRGGSLKALTNVTLVGEETVDKRAAYKLEAQDMRGGALTLWIDKTQLVILKLYRKQKIDPAKLPGGKGAPFETQTTTTFSPQINEPVPHERLEFFAYITK
ncbi:MAG: hypothetical protein HYR56_29420 [Acidobacteria bacterium]|nr:hypothetical protein [Acidobacteriota bacterium]MBI3421503.1 hypothetical protein [Acidobacteriota bacterium]